MKPKHPARWLAGLSMLAVWFVFLLDNERSMPTPISAVHARTAQLAGADDCQQCHGNSAQGLAAACLACHGEIEADLEQARGLHGSIIPETRVRCAECHLEHAGRGFPLVNQNSFRIAGFARRADFDHPLRDYPLEAAHDGLECVECHELADAPLLEKDQQRFRGLSTDCIACHEDGEHAGLMQRACEACHGQALPFEEVDGFEHDQRFPLSGVHGNAACGFCHEFGTLTSIEFAANLPHKPTPRRCAACHESPHSPEFLRGVAQLVQAEDESTCDVCHDSASHAWQDARWIFETNLHAAAPFALAAPHGSLACEDCHALGDVFRERFPQPARRACERCHEDGHGGQFMDGGELRACLDCHAPERFVPAIFDLEQHAATGFALEQAHRAVGCYACHQVLQKGSHEDRLQRLWRPLDDACETCHEDGHGGFFEHRALASEDSAARDCATCHDQQSFANPDSEARFEHERWTGYALEGTHASMACDGCHKAAGEDLERGRFPSIEASFGPLPSLQQPCRTCHTDPHLEDFDDPRCPSEVDGRRGCARCHDTTSFRAASTAGFDHDTWTSRQLAGAHLTLQCENCHRRRDRADALGRRFGRVADLFGEAPRDCERCHADPHGGLFEKTPAGIAVGGRSGCARCHSQESFRSHFLLEFEHDSWTGCDVQAGHAGLSCEACHPPLAAPEARARSAGPAAGRRCAACHLDPHAGQFNSTGPAPCEDCHADQAQWQELVFDHQQDSEYPLDAAHAVLECDACHVPHATPDGSPVTRYKPLGQRCVDCHRVGAQDPR